MKNDPLVVTGNVYGVCKACLIGQTTDSRAVTDEIMPYFPGRVYENSGIATVWCVPFSNVVNAVG